MGTLGFNLLIKNLQSAIDIDNNTLCEVAKAMLEKLKSYQPLVCTELAQIARILDSRFANDLLDDYDILSRHVQLAESTSLSALTTNELGSKPRILFEQPLSQNGTSGSEHENEIHRYFARYDNGRRHTLCAAVVEIERTLVSSCCGPSA